MRFEGTFCALLSETRGILITECLWEMSVEETGTIVPLVPE